MELQYWSPSIQVRFSAALRVMSVLNCARLVELLRSKHVVHPWICCTDAADATPGRNVLDSQPYCNWTLSNSFLVISKSITSYFMTLGLVVRNVVFCPSRFQRAHADHAMTAMALDAQHRRLVTGADNGIMKVWNFSSGACLKEMVSLCSKDITGVPSAARRLPATATARTHLCFQKTSM